MVTGRRRWHTVGFYIAPSNASNIEDVVAVIRARPYGAKLLVDEDINANLEEPEGTLRLEAIADRLTAAGLSDMGLHFLPRQKPWLKDRCTWRIQQDKLEVRYRTDYIIGTHCRLFQDVTFWDTQHQSDHYMVLGCLRGEPEKEITGYLRKLRRYPLRTLHRDLASGPDKLFSELKTHILKPPLRKRVMWAWIYRRDLGIN